MPTLTLDHAIANNFTPIDCVKFFRPNWTDEKCDFYLWECTCYPFSTEILIKQLNTNLSKDD